MQIEPVLSFEYIHVYIMSEMPDWDVVRDAIEPIATNQLENIRSNFPNTTTIEVQEEKGEVRWNFSIEEDERTVLVLFKLVDSEEYEGEKVGYNIILESIQDDGLILTKYVPHNYTDDVWTTEISELERRAEKMPQLQPEDIE